MASFRVWIRPLGSSTKLVVEGSENAHWLLARLGQALGVDTDGSIHGTKNVLRFTFNLAYTADATRDVVDRLLANIPEVKLMLEPA